MTTLFQFLCTLKWIAVPCLPLNIIGLFYVIMYIQEPSFLAIQTLIGTIIGVGMGMYLLVKWNYYKAQQKIGDVKE